MSGHDEDGQQGVGERRVAGRRRAVTIKMVAEAAAVSYQTVSRVINGSDGVAAETHARVLDAMRRLNYRPNPAAQRLARGGTAMVAAIFPLDSRFFFSDPYHLEILGGINHVVTDHGHSLVLSMPRSSASPSSGGGRFLQHHVADGLIVEGNAVGEEIRLLRESGYPVVVVGYADLEAPHVHPDDEGGAYAIAQHLLALGHRRIAIVSGPHDNDAAVQARWRGVTTAFDHGKVPLGRSLIMHGDFTADAGYKCAAEIMSNRQEMRPTAVLAFNDNMAIGLIRWLHEHGYRVPDDISITGFDDVDRAQLINPPLTTVRLDGYEQGRRAAEILFDLLADRPPLAQDISLPSQLIVRRSTTALVP